MFISEFEKAKYSAKVDLIMYAIIKSHIDIAFIIFMVSKFAKNPSLEYYHIIDQILHYLAGSQHKNIILGGEEELKLVRYLDLDCAEDHIDQKFISEFIFMLNRKLVNYASKK